MQYHLMFLWTDKLYWLMWIGIVLCLIRSVKHPHLRNALRKIQMNRLGVASGVILSFFIIISLSDSIHFSVKFPVDSVPDQSNSREVVSLLDRFIAPLGTQFENTYSTPLALYSYVKATRESSNMVRETYYPRLLFAGRNLVNLTTDYHRDILCRLLKGLLSAVLGTGMLCLLWIFINSYQNHYSWWRSFQAILNKRSHPALLTLLISFFLMLFLCAVGYYLAQEYHVLGTDKVGQDVLYESLKSIRTGLVIGMLTTVLTLPFALILGTMAGYFGGVIDDIIQYCYTTLNSIPGVLLIAASILAIQVFISNHPSVFTTITARSDARLFALCAILGLTSWTGLCRLLRAETLKIRELDYISAAKTMGSSHFSILYRHILPNVFYLVIIAIALDFSSLVLAEAVLSTVGVGVDPTTDSWGNMINGARLQLARDPVVWWPLLAAFSFMFVLVLAANLFADVVRDAFDPRENA